MNRLLQLTLCVVLMASTVLASAQDSPSKIKASRVRGERRALLIAVSHYASKSFVSLPSTDADVELMSDVLQNSGFSPQNIRVLQNKSETPTKLNIVEAIKEFADSCNPDDLAFIMLTGHGLRDEKIQTDFFLPIDAKESDFDSFVSLQYVIETLDSSKAKFKWILVDACRELTKGTMGGKSLDRLEPMPGMLIFQSSAPGEVSYFTDDQKHSLFIYNFVEGLKGGAIGDDGRVSVLGAFAYAREMIEDRQHPMMSSKDFDDFVLAENDDWTLAAEFYHKALASVEAKDFIQAQKEIQMALALKTPLRDVYRKKAETINLLANNARKIDDKGETQPSSASSMPPSVSFSDDDADWTIGKAGDRRSITIDGVEYAFRYCPAGIHTMGYPEDEERGEVWEIQHQVKFSRAYWTLETEVTQEMWESVMGENPAYFKGKNLPVEGVSWDDCQEFIKKLNDMGVFPSGWALSLPTEAEWEVAARAGSATAFPWGDALNGDEANCDGNYPYGTETKGKFLNKTSEVKSYSPNAWGIYDMAGNVWEWCLDTEGAYPASGKTDPLGKGGAGLVLRGGSWRNDAHSCRSSLRRLAPAPRRFYDLGFRCVLSESIVRQRQGE